MIFTIAVYVALFLAYLSIGSLVARFVFVHKMGDLLRNKVDGSPATKTLKQIDSEAQIDEAKVFSSFAMFFWPLFLPLYLAFIYVHGPTVYEKHEQKKKQVEEVDKLLRDAQAELMRYMGEENWGSENDFNNFNNPWKP